jgi:hypothetical protein
MLALPQYGQFSPAPESPPAIGGDGGLGEIPCAFCSKVVLSPEFPPALGSAFRSNFVSLGPPLLLSASLFAFQRITSTSASTLPSQVCLVMSSLSISTWDALSGGIDLMTAFYQQPTPERKIPHDANPTKSMVATRLQPLACAPGLRYAMKELLV